MTLMDQIETHLKEAMKAQKTEVTSTLRMLKAAILNEAIRIQKDRLEDPAILDIIQKQVKQCKESIASFTTAGRTELAAKEERELQILQQYMPAQLSEDDLRALIQKTMTETGVSLKADQGKLMKVLMPLVKGKADGQTVNRLVSSFLK